MRFVAFLLPCLFVISTAVAGQPRTTAPKPAADRSTASPPKNAQTDANVERHVRSMQLALERESKKLEARFAQLSKLREAALKKNDKQLLRRVETLERTAVQSYEKRVESLLSASPPSPRAYPTKQSKAVEKKPAAPAAPPRSSGWRLFGR